MAGLPFSEIDLVLQQFGAPWSETWNGDASGYLLHHLGMASDETLAAVDDYYGGRGGDGDAGSSVWSGDLFRLFLSHPSADKVFVSDVKVALRSYGIEGFVAHEDIEPTAEWQNSIVSALDTCDALAAVLTDDFPTSNWCDQEVGHCIGQRKLIVPLARSCMPYGFMGRYQALKCADGEPERIAGRVAKVLIGNPLTAGRMADALIANLERSDSYVEARSNMALVRQIRMWTPEMLRRLEGCTRNSQVSHAYGVPAAIEGIVAEHSNPASDDSQEIPF